MHKKHYNIVRFSIINTYTTLDESNELELLHDLLNSAKKDSKLCGLTLEESKELEPLYDLFHSTKKE